MTIPAGLQAGDELAVIRLPLSGIAPDQPALPVRLEFTVSSSADAGVPLTVVARSGFALGADALGNPASDPSLQGADQTFSVAPQPYRVRATLLAEDGQIATGPNRPVGLRLDVDVADGQTLTGVDLSAGLAAGMQFTPITGTPASIGSEAVGASPTGSWTNVNGVLVSAAAVDTATASAVAPGGTVTRTIGSVTGSSVGSDAAMVVQIHVPELDSGAAPVVDPVSGDAISLFGDAAVNASWTPTDGRDPAAAPTTSLIGDYHLVAQSAVLHKREVAETDVGPTGFSPGDTIGYRLQIDISDYFAFGGDPTPAGDPGSLDLLLVDRLSDGLSLIDSGTTPAGVDPVLTVTRSDGSIDTLALARGINYTVSPDPSGAEVVTFDLRSAFGGPGGDRYVGDLFGADNTLNTPMQARIEFQARVLESYRVAPVDEFGQPLAGSAQPALNGGDRAVNQASFEGTVLDASLDPEVPGLGGERDDGLVRHTVPVQDVAVDIVGLNGSTIVNDPGAPVPASAGETLTFRLRATIPAADYEGLLLEAFLPEPMFDVSDPDADGTPGGWSAAAVPTVTPAAGEVSVLTSGGDGGTVNAPVVTPDGGSNVLRFDFGNRVDAAGTPLTVDVYFTLALTTDAYPTTLPVSVHGRQTLQTTALETLNSEDLDVFAFTTPVSTGAPTAVLTVVDSSLGSSAAPVVVPGEIVRYRAVVQLPEGVATGAEIRPALPPGLRYVNDGATTVGFVANDGSGGIDSSTLTGASLDLAGGGADAGAISAIPPSLALAGPAIVDGTGTPLAPNQILASGVDPVFRLGDLSNGDADADAEFVVVEFNAIVENESVNVSGHVLDAQFDYFAQGAVRASSNTESLNVDTPAIFDVDKRVVATAADQVTFEVTFSNTGGQVAHDVRLIDDFAGLANISFNGPAGVTGQPAGAADNSTASALDVAIPTLLSGQSVTIRYTATVADVLAAVAEREAVVTYTSLDTAGETLSVNVEDPGGNASLVTLTTTGERTGDTADHGGAANTFRDAEGAGLAVIRGRLWDDTLSPDGVIGASENRLDGITVTLLYAGLDGVFGNGDDQVRTVATDDGSTWLDGEYRFGMLAAGNYRLTVPTALTDAQSGPLEQTFERGLVGLSDGMLELGPSEGEFCDDHDLGYLKVNSAPLVASPGSATVGEDSTLIFTGANLVAVGDPDLFEGFNPAPLDGFAMTVSAAQGTLDATAAGAATVSGQGTSVLTLTGSIADLNATLNGMAYRPNAGYNGADTVDVRIDDRGQVGNADGDAVPGETVDDALSGSSAITITVTAAPDDPIARPDATTALTDGTPALGNAVTAVAPGDQADSDDDPGDVIAVAGVAPGTSVGPVSGGVGAAVPGAHGSLTVQSDGAYAYVADTANPAVASLAAGQTLTDVFTYTIDDGTGRQATTTITITLQGLANPPDGSDRTLTVSENLVAEGGVPLSITAADFGFTDPDAGDSMSAVRIDTLPASGTLALNGVPVVAGQVIATGDLGGLTYTPAPGVSNLTLPALPALTFSVIDSTGLTDPAPNTLTIDITPSNGSLPPPPAPGPGPGQPGGPAAPIPVPGPAPVPGPVPAPAEPITIPGLLPPATGTPLSPIAPEDPAARIVMAETDPYIEQDRLAFEDTLRDSGMVSMLSPIAPVRPYETLDDRIARQEAEEARAARVKAAREVAPDDEAPVPKGRPGPVALKRGAPDGPAFVPKRFTEQIQEQRSPAPDRRTSTGR